MKGYGQDAVYYAHAGAGELHLRPILNLKKSDDVALFRAITTDVARLTKKYRGFFQWRAWGRNCKGRIHSFDDRGGKLRAFKTN